jgi:hypothetical protein
VEPTPAQDVVQPAAVPVDQTPDDERSQRSSIVSLWPSARRKQRQAANTDKRADATLAGLTASADTALACLFRLGVQNGIYAEIGAVRRRNLIEGDTLPVSRVIEVAAEFGLAAERALLDWLCGRGRSAIPCCSS